MGNGRNTVSRVPFREWELSDFFGQTRWDFRKAWWVCFCTQIIGWEELKPYLRASDSKKDYQERIIKKYIQIGKSGKSDKTRMKMELLWEEKEQTIKGIEEEMHGNTERGRARLREPKIAKRATKTKRAEKNKENKKMQNYKNARRETIVDRDKRRKKKKKLN